MNDVQTYNITLFDCETTTPEYVGTFSCDYTADQAEAIRSYLEAKGGHGEYGIYLVVAETGTHYGQLTRNNYLRFLPDAVTLQDNGDGTVDLVIAGDEDHKNFPA